MLTIQAKSKIKLMSVTLTISVVLMGLKFIAYYHTGSNAILTDALESIINVTAGLFALISIYYASRPRDENHPYGHGKIEYLSAGFEGGLILIAGLSMIIKAAYGFLKPNTIESLDLGIYISAFTGAVNYIVGFILIRKGKQNHSSLMIADGKHLISDTISSIGLIAGLIAIWLTGKFWLDNVLTIIFGLYILHTGTIILKESINSLLDEADYEKLKHLTSVLNENRKDQWVDMHNLRVLKFGPLLHVDCHITLPWYFSLEESHQEVNTVETILNDNTEGEVEFFIHADPCLPSSCPICNVQNCPKRKATFVKRLDWTVQNMLPNQKHSL